MSGRTREGDPLIPLTAIVNQDHELENKTAILKWSVDTSTADINQNDLELITLTANPAEPYFTVTVDGVPPIDSIGKITWELLADYIQEVERILGSNYCVRTNLDEERWKQLINRLKGPDGPDIVIHSVKWEKHDDKDSFLRKNGKLFSVPIAKAAAYRQLQQFAFTVTATQPNTSPNIYEETLKQQRNKLRKSRQAKCNIWYVCIGCLLLGVLFLVHMCLKRSPQTNFPMSCLKDTDCFYSGCCYDSTVQDCPKSSIRALVKSSNSSGFGFCSTRADGRYCSHSDGLQCSVPAFASYISVFAPTFRVVAYPGGNLYVNWKFVGLPNEQFQVFLYKGEDIVQTLTELNPDKGSSSVLDRPVSGFGETDNLLNADLAFGDNYFVKVVSPDSNIFAVSSYFSILSPVYNSGNIGEFNFATVPAGAVLPTICNHSLDDKSKFYTNLFGTTFDARKISSLLDVQTNGQQAFVVPPVSTTVQNFGGYCMDIPISSEIRISPLSYFAKKSDSEVFETASNASLYVAASAGFNISLGPIFDALIGLAQDALKLPGGDMLPNWNINNDISKAFGNGGSYGISETEYLHYTAKYVPSDDFLLTRQFQAFIEDLPNIFEYSTYDKFMGFIATYGTHVVTSWSVGIKYQIKFKTTKAYSSTKSSVTSAIAALFESIDTDTGVAYGSSSERDVISWEIEMVGGHPNIAIRSSDDNSGTGSRVCCLDEFVEDGKSSPAIVALSAMDQQNGKKILSQTIDTLFFGTKKQALFTAIVYYLAGKTPQRQWWCLWLCFSL